MIIPLLILLVLFWIILFRCKRRRLYELASKVPALPGEIPVLGIAHRFIGNTEHILSLLKKSSYDSMKLGGTSRSWLGHLLYFIILDPADIEKVLKTCLEKDDITRFIRNVLGNGIIYAPVPIWKVRRKVLVPAFAPKIVERFITVFVEQGKVLANELKSNVGKAQFELWPYINRYAMDSVCETALGVKIKAQGDPSVPFLIALNRITNLVSERMFRLWLHPDCLYRLFRGKYNEHEKHQRTLRDFTDEVISRKRKELCDIKNPETYCNFNVLERYLDRSFLDLLIKSSGGEKGYNDVELREEIETIIIAGTDTSAIAIANIIVLLGKYPDVQRKVHNELLEIFEDSNRPLVKEDLPKLKYLERVIKETLRLFPPGPFLVRKVLTETSLPSGRVLPAGSGVLISVWGAHRDPKYWGPNAEHFDPDRFLSERLILKNPCSYLPFSNGPRNCIALILGLVKGDDYVSSSGEQEMGSNYVLSYQYALMSIKIAVSSVLRQYTVVVKPEDGPIPQMRMKFDVMMKAVDGYKIALEKKNGAKRT